MIPSTEHIIKSIRKTLLAKPLGENSPKNNPPNNINDSAPHSPLKYPFVLLFAHAMNAAIIVQKYLDDIPIIDTVSTDIGLKYKYIDMLQRIRNASIIPANPANNDCITSPFIEPSEFACVFIISLFIVVSLYIVFADR